jgi:hypothetical protein
LSQERENKTFFKQVEDDIIQDIKEGKITSFKNADLKRYMQKRIERNREIYSIARRDDGIKNKIAESVYYDLRK